MKKALAFFVTISALLFLSASAQTQDAPPPDKPAEPAQPAAPDQPKEEPKPPEAAPPAPGPGPAPAPEGEPAKKEEPVPAPAPEPAKPEPEAETDSMPKFPGRTALAGLPALDGAKEKHEAILGENGRAALFLADESRVRVAGAPEGARFGYYAGIEGRAGYALRLDSGSLELHIGVNPVRVVLPQGEVAFEGMGTQVLLAVAAEKTTVSRPGGESGKLALFLDGRSLEIQPGGSAEVTVQAGLGPDAVDGAPSEPRAPEKTSETYNYCSGTNGSFEVTLPGESRINGGDVSELMLTANRVPESLFFLGEMRDGAFNVNARPETSLLLETVHHRLTFAPVVPKEPASGEGEPAGKAEEPSKPGEEPKKPAGEEDMALPGVPGPRLPAAARTVSTAQAPEGGNEIWVAIKGELEFIRHSQGGAVTLESKVVVGFGVVLSVGGGASLITLKDQGRVLVDAFESEEGAQPVKIIIGGKVFILPPSAKAKVAAVPRHPEEEGEIVVKAGALDVMVYGMGHPLSCRFVIQEGAGVFQPVVNSAFENTGDVRTTEASPYLP